MFKPSFRAVIGTSAALGALALATSAQSTPLVFEAGTITDHFGTSMDYDGGRLAVGAPGQFAFGVGDVYVYDPNACQQLVSIPSPTGVGSGVGNFGISVSLDGNRLAVGGYQSVLGVYDASTGQPIWEKTLVDCSAISVSLSGNVLLAAVGTPFYGANSYTAHLYDASTGTQYGNSNGALIANASVALDGDMAAIVRTSGSVAILDVSAWTFTFLGTLSLPAGATPQAVTIDGDMALVGGYTGTFSVGQPMAWVFDLTTMQLVQSLQPMGGAALRWVYSVDLEGNRAALGVLDNDPIAPISFVTGEAFVFDWTTGQELDHWSPPAPVNMGNAFGASIALNGDTCYVGSAEVNDLGQGGGQDSGKVYAWGIGLQTPPAANYCSGKLNSQGCTAQIGASGTASLSATTPLDVTATSVLSGATGLLYYTTAGSDSLPMAGGILCLASPLGRAGLGNSGGSAPPFSDCSGTFTYDLNGLLQGAVGQTMAPGDPIFLQWWYRDTVNPDGTGIGLSDALKVVVGP